MLYSVSVAFSAEFGPWFRSYYGAVVGFWCRDSLVSGGNNGLRSLLEGQLTQGGWIVADILSVERVDAKTYDANPDGKSFYEQALVDGVVAHIHRTARREHRIDASKSKQAWTEDGFRRFKQEIWQHGATCLTVGEHPWAIRTQGEVEIPLWSNLRDPVEWAPPNAKRRKFNPDELRISLLRWHAERSLVCIGMTDDSLVTFHPYAILDRRDLV